MGNEEYGHFEFEASYQDNNITSNQVKIIEEKDAVNIRVSIFFDGTNNNKFNTEGRLEFFNMVHGRPYNATAAAAYEARVRSGKSGLQKDDSYSNDYSNVARLFKYYEEDSSNIEERTGCIYVEGIGTTTSEGDQGITYGDDNKIGGGLGAGSTGIPEKVKKGCEELAKKINFISKKKDIKSLKLDVFGFSRGAAAARHFLYEISKDKVEAHTESFVSTGGVQTINIPEQPARGALGKALIEQSLIFEGEIHIQFAGLFDTVPSYLALRDGGTQLLHLDAVKRADDVLHLTAMDERRANFGLADVISSKGVKYEKALPGVHSDIGGGYNPVVFEEDKVVYAGSYYGMKDEIAYLLEEGWYWSEKQLECHFGIIGTVTKGGILNPQGYIKTVGKKKVQNQYCYIPLFIMRDKAKNYPNKIKFLLDLDDDIIIPEELSYTNQRLRSYVFKNGEAMRFYTRSELDKEIEWIELKAGGFDKFDESYIAQPMSTKVSQTTAINKEIEISDTDSTLDSNHEISASDYPNYPDLRRKIYDYQTLKWLRANYFHTSHDCSTLKAGTGIPYFDPYKSSIRTKPSRKITHS